MINHFIKKANFVENTRKMKENTRKTPQKTIGSAVTTQEYAEILMKSANEGLTMSAYVYKKLFSNDIKTLEKGGGLGTTTIKEVDSKETIEKVKKLQKEALDCKESVSSLQKEINALKSSKMPNKATLDLLDKLFKLNSSLFSVIDGKTNPYFDLVVKIQSELKKD